jgi:polysaccharide biosynthesis transport protein
MSHPALPPGHTSPVPAQPSPGANGEPDLFAHRDRFQLRDLWHCLVRQRALVALCCLGTLGAVGLYTWWAVPVYQATSTIRIDPKQTALPIPDVLKSLSPDGDVGTELEVLRSRSIAVAVIDSLALSLKVVSPRRTPRSQLILAPQVAEDAEPGDYRVRRAAEGYVFETAAGRRLASFAAGEVVSAGGIRFALAPGIAEFDEVELRVLPREEALRRVRRSLQVSRPSRDAAILQVRYRSSDPELVRAVPNVIAQEFIDQRHDVQKTEVRSTVRFISGQLDTLHQQLSTAENALRSFRESAQAVDLSVEASAGVGRLAELQAERGGVAAERAALGQLLTEVQQRVAEGVAPHQPSPYRRLVAFPSLLRNQVATEMLRSLAAAEDQRTQLLSRRSREDPDVVILTQRIHELERQIHEIAATYLSGLSNQVQALDGSLAQFGQQLSRIPAKEVEFARLRRESAALEEIYGLMQARLKEAQIAQAAEDPSVRVVDRAVAPYRPVHPKPMLNLSAALFFGLLLGSAAALTREQMDRTVRSRKDVLVATGVPVLGLIPGLGETRPWAKRIASLGGLRGRLAPASRSATPDPTGRRLLLDRRADDWEAMSEMYARIWTNVAFARPDERVQVLLITSALASDGKTTTASNLAISVARSGQRVLLIDADLRRGMLHEVFGVSVEPGLTELLLEGPTENSLRRVELEGEGRLDYLTAGRRGSHPAQLLGSTRMQALLRSLRERYDLIVIDTPPVNLVADAALLSAAVDGVLLVARAGTSRMEAVAFAAEQLRAARAPLLGTVINGIDFQRDAAYDDAYTWYGRNSYSYLAANAQGSRTTAA